MVFKTIQEWVMRSGPEFFLGEEKMVHTQQSYKYLGVSFKGPSFSYRKLPVLNFLMDMQPLVLLRDNVHTKTSKNHKLIVVTWYACDTDSSLWNRTVGLSLHKVNN